MRDVDCKYYLNNSNEFVIENYNKVAPFSSFLPAISGLFGKIELHMGNETVQIEGSQIQMPYALDIRNNKVDRIDVYMK